MSLSKSSISHEPSDTNTFTLSQLSSSKVNIYYNKFIQRVGSLFHIDPIELDLLYDRIFECLQATSFPIAYSTKIHGLHEYSDKEIEELVSLARGIEKTSGIVRGLVKVLEERFLCEEKKEEENMEKNISGEREIKFEISCENVDSNMVLEEGSLELVYSMGENMSGIESEEKIEKTCETKDNKSIGIVIEKEQKSNWISVNGNQNNAKEEPISIMLSNNKSNQKLSVNKLIETKQNKEKPADENEVSLTIDNAYFDNFESNQSIKNHSQVQINHHQSVSSHVEAYSLQKEKNSFEQIESIQETNPVNQNVSEYGNDRIGFLKHENEKEEFLEEARKSELIANSGFKDIPHSFNFQNDSISQIEIISKPKQKYEESESYINSESNATIIDKLSTNQNIQLEQQVNKNFDLIGNIVKEESIGKGENLKEEGHQAADNCLEEGRQNKEEKKENEEELAYEYQFDKKREKVTEYLTKLDERNEFLKKCVEEISFKFQKDISITEESRPLAPSSSSPSILRKPIHITNEAYTDGEIMALKYFPKKYNLEMGNKERIYETHDITNVGFSVSEVDYNPEHQEENCDQLTERINCQKKEINKKEIATYFEPKEILGNVSYEFEENEKEDKQREGTEEKQRETAYFKREKQEEELTSAVINIDEAINNKTSRESEISAYLPKVEERSFFNHHYHANLQSNQHEHHIHLHDSEIDLAQRRVNEMFMKIKNIRNDPLIPLANINTIQETKNYDIQPVLVDLGRHKEERVVGEESLKLSREETFRSNDSFVVDKAYKNTTRLSFIYSSPKKTEYTPSVHNNGQATLGSETNFNQTLQFQQISFPILKPTLSSKELPQYRENFNISCQNLNNMHLRNSSMDLNGIISPIKSTLISPHNSLKNRLDSTETFSRKQLNSKPKIHVNCLSPKMSPTISPKSHNMREKSLLANSNAQIISIVNPQFNKSNIKNIPEPRQHIQNGNNLPNEQTLARIKSEHLISSRSKQVSSPISRVHDSNHRFMEKTADFNHPSKVSIPITISPRQQRNLSANKAATQQVKSTKNNLEVSTEKSRSRSNRSKKGIRVMSKEHKKYFL